MAKKVKLRGRNRKLNKAQAFPKREQRELDWMMFKLRQTFPDPAKRLQYIKNLIKGLDEEPIVEVT
jgi:hypothetical protein